MNAQTENVDLLDGTLDDLADLPEFKPFPTGAYRVALEFSEKKINDKPAVEMKMKLREIMEVGETLAEGENLPEVGKAETNILMILRNNDGSRNEIAEGQLKNIIKALQPVFGGANNREVLANAKGAEVVVVLRTKHDKKADVMRQQLHEMIVQ